MVLSPLNPPSTCPPRMGPALFFSPRSEKQLGPHASPVVTGNKAGPLAPRGTCSHAHCGYIQSGGSQQCLGEAMDDVGRQSLISHSGDHREGSYPIFWEPVRMASLLAQSGKWRATHTRQGLATCEGPLFMLTRATGTPDRGLAHTRGAPGFWAFRQTRATAPAFSAPFANSRFLQTVCVKSALGAVSPQPCPRLALPLLHHQPGCLVLSPLPFGRAPLPSPSLISIRTVISKR